jgi:hypothetical protein
MKVRTNNFFSVRYSVGILSRIDNAFAMADHGVVGYGLMGENAVLRYYPPFVHF